MEDITLSMKRSYPDEEDESNKIKKYVRVHQFEQGVNGLHQPLTSNVGDRETSPYGIIRRTPIQIACKDSFRRDPPNYSALNVPIDNLVEEVRVTYSNHDALKKSNCSRHQTLTSSTISWTSAETTQSLYLDQSTEARFTIDFPNEKKEEIAEEDVLSVTNSSTDKMYRIKMKIIDFFHKPHLRFFSSMVLLLVIGSTFTFSALGMILLPLQDSNPHGGISILTFTLISTITTAFSYSLLTPESTMQTRDIRHNPHVILPTEAIGYDKAKKNVLSNITLRQFLSHPDGFHLGLAPSFFGFYVYFGALTAFHENVLTVEDQQRGVQLLPVQKSNTTTPHGTTQVLLKSVAGASAGAMAAVLLSSGMNPREAADFASSMTLGKFADFPGLGGIFRGKLFEKIMVDTLKAHQSIVNNNYNRNKKNVRLEDGYIPVAVTGFDVLSWKGKILTKGCMGRAARASACFPLLFQPCKWKDDDGESRASYLIDGALRDSHGLVGLTVLNPNEKNKRVVNIVAGSFSGGIIGPSDAPVNLDIHEMLSISIENAPQCGPWAMGNGQKAVVAARDAIIALLDMPLYEGKENGHYVLHIDCASFIPSE